MEHGGVKEWESRRVLNEHTRRLWTMSIEVVLGSQWGDEGKGRFVDELAAGADVVARFNGGGNAGHTIVAQGETFKLHLVPSGVLHEHVTCVIGNGVLVDLVGLHKEILCLIDAGIPRVRERIKISSDAHLVFGFHKDVDEHLDRILGIGTTKQGVGVATATKALRNGVQVKTLLNEQRFSDSYCLLRHFACQLCPGVDTSSKELDQLRSLIPFFGPMIVRTSSFVHSSFSAGQRIIAEGANAAMLDPDHGTYPFVTSTPTTIGGLFCGLGVNANMVSRVYGVAKAYTTRVGEGPFVTELLNEVGVLIREAGGEYGTTTKRPRRCGWIDLVQMGYSHKLNGYNQLFLTKIDVLSKLEKVKACFAYKNKETQEQVTEYPEGDLSQYEPVYKEFDGWSQDKDISQVRQYEDLPPNCRNFIEFIQSQVGVPVTKIGLSPSREAVINKQ